MASAKNAVPEGYHTITPQLTVDDAARAIDWYKKALGAEELGRSNGPDGKVMHAELKIGGSRIFVNDPVMDNKGPKAYGGFAGGTVAVCRGLRRPLQARDRSRRSGPHAGRQSVLGRSHGRVRRSARIQLVGRDAEGRPDEGGNGSPRSGILQGVRQESATAAHT
jgi:catechol 2,3-dioxygenase-like lactoylglutathione lyase family enzyme